MSDHPRRRAGEPDAGKEAPPVVKTPESQRKRRKRSARDFFRRFRQPLVGLGIIGATAPVISSKEAEAETPKESDAATPEDAAQQSDNLEESIATRNAQTPGD